MRPAMDLHTIDQRRSFKESAFNADTVAGDPPHHETLVVAAAAQADYGAAKFLDPFVGAFSNAQEYADHVARIKVRDIRVYRCFNRLK